MSGATPIKTLGAEHRPLPRRYSLAASVVPQADRVSENRDRAREVEMLLLLANSTCRCPSGWCFSCRTRRDGGFTYAVRTKEFREVVDVDILLWENARYAAVRFARYSGEGARANSLKVLAPAAPGALLHIWSIACREDLLPIALGAGELPSRVSGHW